MIFPLRGKAYGEFMPPGHSIRWRAGMSKSIIWGSIARGHDSNRESLLKYVIHLAPDSGVKGLPGTMTLNRSCRRAALAAATFGRGRWKLKVDTQYIPGTGVHASLFEPTSR